MQLWETERVTSRHFAEFCPASVKSLDPGRPPGGVALHGRDTGRWVLLGHLSRLRGGLTKASFARGPDTKVCCFGSVRVTPVREGGDPSRIRGVIPAPTGRGRLRVQRAAVRSRCAAGACPGAAPHAACGRSPPACAGLRFSHGKRAREENFTRSAPKRPRRARACKAMVLCPACSRRL